MPESRRFHSVSEFLLDLVAGGRHHFDSLEVRRALRISPDAAKLALYRLAKRGLVASPARGFYVVVPPEHRSLGCLPPEEFVPALMQRSGIPYYAGLLTAARYHGAVREAAGDFQVIIAGSRRPIACGRVRVTFVRRRGAQRAAVQRVTTGRGTLLVSTPETTALDLVGYANHAGGIARVAEIIARLSASIDGARLVTAAKLVPPPWAQRLGFLLDRAGASDKTDPLAAWVQTHTRQSTRLVAGAAVHNETRDATWRLYINAAL